MSEPKFDSVIYSTLPTKADVFNEYKSLINKGHTGQWAIQALSEQLVKIWTKADCPCIDARHVKIKLSNLLKDHKEAIREPRGSHQRKKPKNEQPTRRSARKRDQETSQEDSDEQELSQSESVPVVETSSASCLPISGLPRPHSRTRASFEVTAEYQWMLKNSKELFDILSGAKINSDNFDEHFYNDQNGPRILRIEKKLNPDYKAQCEREHKEKKHLSTS